MTLRKQNGHHETIRLPESVMATRNSMASRKQDGKVAATYFLWAHCSLRQEVGVSCLYTQRVL